MTAWSLPIQPSCDMRMNSGTTPSCVGTAVVAMTNTSRALRPRKRSFENEKPASVENSTTDSDVIVPTMIELVSAFQNWMSPFEHLADVVEELSLRDQRRDRVLRDVRRVRRREQERVVQRRDRQDDGDSASRV